MDDRAFDRWILALGERLTRRRLHHGGGLLGLLSLAVAARDETGAKKRRKNEKGNKDTNNKNKGGKKKEKKNDKKCKGRTQRCGKRCVNLQTDPMHCGRCGHPCDAGQPCSAGQCSKPVCPPNCQGRECGPDECGGACGACTGGSTCNAQGQCVCPQQVDSIEALRDLSTPPAACVTARGYYQPGDGGGGDFNWDTAAAEADNGGTVIAPRTPGPAGRWRREFNGPLSVLWFGAVTDESGIRADEAGPLNQQRIQAAIQAARAGETVAIPTGTFRVQVTCPDVDALLEPNCIVPAGQPPAGYHTPTETRDAILLKSGVSLVGNGPSSRIHGVAARVNPPRGDVQLARLLVGTSVSDVTIRNLRVSSTGTLQSAFDFGIFVNGLSTAPAQNVAIEGCEIDGFRKSGVRSTGPRVTDRASVRDLRVVDCNVHDIGRMQDIPGRSECGAQTDQTCSVVFGVGINPNGVDKGTIARNRIQNVGVCLHHWGIYGNEDHDVTVEDNTVIDCAGGIAWSGVGDGRDNIVFSGNKIDLALDKDPDWRLGAGEAPFVPSRIGLQLRGNDSDAPLQCDVLRNELRMANIQLHVRDAKVKNNVVDLATVGNFIGLWVGWSGWRAVNVEVSGNVVKATPPDEGTPTRGIVVSAGSEIQVVDNEIIGTPWGIALGIDSGMGVSGVVERSLFARNRISDITDRHCFYLNGTDDVEVSDNVCDGGTNVGRAIQVGDNNAPNVNRALRIIGNRVLTPGVCFGVAPPKTGESLPRQILIEDNECNTGVVGWPPFTSESPQGVGYTAFVDGDILRGNELTEAAAQQAEAMTVWCYRSAALHGNASVPRPLLPHQEGGRRKFSVLGGEEFRAPENGPATAPECPPAIDSVAFLSHGYVGQVISIKAQGGAVEIVDQADEQTGNIHLVDRTSRTLAPGDRVRLELRASGTWNEI